MARSASLLIVSFLALFSHVSVANPIGPPGWYLDSSCSADSDAIRNVMGRAFTQVDWVVQELRKPTLDPDVQNLFGMIFPNTADMKDRVVKGLFESILAMRNELQTIDPDNPETVIIYCNQNRFVPHPAKPDFKWDPTIQRQISYTGDNRRSIDECNTRNPVSKDYTMAYTSNEPNIPRTAAQIQLCPWYLEATFKKQFDQSKSYRFRRFAMVIWDRTFGKWTGTQIDAFADIATTMVHELAHTKKAGSVALGGGTTDDAIGYGWKRIYEGRNNNAHHNADSHAYLALGIKMMKTENPRLVSETGQLRPRPAGVLRRSFNQMKRWVA